eukprot:TRINITY_DN4450_c0_g2_i1.p1 TRINITY_DN4450_c0_g2~~TRINITY_DN4450_c0_g2_i1.p1  ORF type:complete len:329 (-),score=34.99 TRINITY_DN4450_c0_g2_i1:294-1280(-)
MVELFSVPAFFILFREALEASIIVAVMMSILDKIVEDKEVLKKMRRQAWLGVFCGIAVAAVAGAIFISLYYTVAKDAWQTSEPIFEGVLLLIAVSLITMMAFAMIRVDTWRVKWEKKLTKVTMESLALKNDPLHAGSRRTKFAIFFIPFLTLLREGCEAVIFMGGVGLTSSGTAIPIPIVVGAACGCLVGYILYVGGNHIAFRYFLTCATAFFFVIAAGLFTRAVHEFEEYTKNEDFVWQLKCCDQNENEFWKIMQSIFGWRNEATVGTLTAYIAYWVFVIVMLVILHFKWKRDAERELEREAVEEAKLGNDSSQAILDTEGRHVADV